MASTQEFLAQKGVSMDQALAFIMANLQSPLTIFNVARSNNVTTAMLADIVQPMLPGTSSTQVKEFFAGHSLDANLLDATSGSTVVDLRSVPYVYTASGWTNTKLEAGNGAYEFIVDLAKDQTIQNHPSKTSNPLGYVEITNFGEDDSIRFVNSGSTFILFNDRENYTHIQVDRSALLSGLGRETIDLIGITAYVKPNYGGEEMVSIFNQLPVGDLYFS